MMKRIVLMIIAYIGAGILWVFGVLFPYSEKIMIHVQDHINKHMSLDLVYCVKQLFNIVLWALAFTICVWTVWMIIIYKNNK